MYQPIMFQPITNGAQATHVVDAANVPEFGDSLAGIAAAIALSALLAALAFALATWPAETLRWSALALAVAALGLGGLAPRGPMGMSLPGTG